MERRSGAWRTIAVAAWVVQATAAAGLGVWPDAYGPDGPQFMRDDVRIYFDYASRVISGLVPYRDFPAEYPPGAFVLFVIPRLVAHTLPVYRVVFGALIVSSGAVIVALATSLVFRAEGRRRAIGRMVWYTACFVVLCPLVVNRYDLVPTALAFAAACAWFSGRGRLGGLLAGLGGLVKIFPGIVALPGVLNDLSTPGPWRYRLRGVGAATAVVVAAVGLWWAIAGPSGIRTFVTYHAERGIEIGSLYAGLAGAWARFREVPIRTAYEHFSVELTAPGCRTMARLAFPIQGACLLLMAARHLRDGRSDPMRTAAGAVTTLIAFGKVLSPQYLLWPLPFLTVVRGPTGAIARRIAFVACVLTTLIYPWGFRIVTALQPVGLLALNARNALLVALWLVLLLGPPAPAPGVPPENTAKKAA